MTSDSNIAVRVTNLTKRFLIPLESSNGIKQKLTNLLKGRKGSREFTPLKDISFEIKKGEFFGIVGRNGSGKSTLLKTIAGIYTPDKGSVWVNGSLVPFIELGVGFNPELTGRENVFLNGALLGFSRKEVLAMYDEIVDFAELHDFMEERLKNYSSGMQVRLAFSIAIRAKSDILLLDEILAVGDEAFQKKCIDYFYAIKKSGQTVILVTHDMTNVERFCDRALVLHDNKIVGIYKPLKAKLVYERLNRVVTTNTTNDSEERWGNREASIKSVTILGGDERGNVYTGEPMTIRVQLKSKDIKNVIVGMAIYDNSGLVISGPNSQDFHFTTSDTIDFIVPALPVNSGEYSLRVALYAEDHITEYDHIEHAAKLSVLTRGSRQYGMVSLLGVWEKNGE